MSSRRQRRRTAGSTSRDPQERWWSSGLSRGWKLLLAAAAAIVTLTGAYTAVRGVVHHERTTPDARITNLAAVPESLADFRLRQRIAPVQASGGLLVAQVGDAETAPPPTIETTSVPTGTTTTATAPSPPSGEGPVVACSPTGNGAPCADPGIVELCLPDAAPGSPLRCPDALAVTAARHAASSLHTQTLAIRSRVVAGTACERDIGAPSCPFHDLARSGGDTGGGGGYRRLVAGIRATRARPAAGQRSDLLGMVVSFDADLEELADHDVDVTWTLYGIGSPRGLAAGWFKDRRALRWRVESRHDHGSADVWIPLPPRHGRYFARLTLRQEDGTRLTFADTKPFG